jgi:predicted O-methyltransferase YrrM
MIDHYWHTLPGPQWFSGARIYAEQVERARNEAVFVELGAWKGRSAAFMGVEIANSGKRIKFYTVDHWRGNLKEKDQADDEDVRLGRLFDAFVQNVKPVKDYIHPLRSDSSKAAQQFADDSVDFVYVDAEHTYASTARNIASWWPKLKSNGVLAGDDWCFFDLHRYEFGVRRAVKEFLIPLGIKIHVLPGDPNPEWEQWLALKPG